MNWNVNYCCKIILGKLQSFGVGIVVHFINLLFHVNAWRSKQLLAGIPHRHPWPASPTGILDPRYPRPTSPTGIFDRHPRPASPTGIPHRHPPPALPTGIPDRHPRPTFSHRPLVSGPPPVKPTSRSCLLSNEDKKSTSSELFGVTRITLSLKISNNKNVKVCTLFIPFM